jgi:hypothetical protein
MPTTTIPAADGEQVAGPAAHDGPPALLIAGPDVAAASGRGDFLLSPTALWAATGGFALLALLAAALTMRYWRRTLPG